MYRLIDTNRPSANFSLHFFILYVLLYFGLNLLLLWWSIGICLSLLVLCTQLIISSWRGRFVCLVLLVKFLSRKVDSYNNSHVFYKQVNHNPHLNETVIEFTCINSEVDSEDYRYKNCHNETDNPLNFHQIQEALLADTISQFLSWIKNQKNQR